MPDSLVDNYLLIRVSLLIRETANVETVTLITSNLVSATNAYVTSTFVPLYANAYANSVMTITTVRL